MTWRLKCMYVCIAYLYMKRVPHFRAIAFILLATGGTLYKSFNK